ncbi:MAG: hypothetical protein IAC58_07125 [Firmicutes bacterium]|uniref:Uncharacterized protein n=1 Tax=Candidatus Onthovivens merdipullorum TaxID=2840889 RepID=A0A9D9DKY8_9BACL|nr:hypothetical protein [Candidatus Onthovivens merdipullorum]
MKFDSSEDKIISKDIENLDTIYKKRWQSNGYFPIEKIDKLENDLYLVYVKKINTINSCEFWHPIGNLTLRQLMYSINNNSCIITDYELTNENEYNFEK